MSLAALLPSDISVGAVTAICIIAVIAGVARGFSGFGSALIFMPLASSIAPPMIAPPMAPSTVPAARLSWLDCTHPGS